MKVVKIIFLIIFLILSLTVTYFTFLRKYYYLNKYKSPVYLENGGLFGSPFVRCLCYGEIKSTKYNPAADPSSVGYCDGWEDQNSCEVKANGQNWSHKDYITPFEIIKNDLINRFWGSSKNKNIKTFPKLY